MSRRPTTRRTSSTATRTSHQPCFDPDRLLAGSLGRRRRVDVNRVPVPQENWSCPRNPVLLVGRHPFGGEITWWEGCASTVDGRRAGSVVDAVGGGCWRCPSWWTGSGSCQRRMPGSGRSSLTRARGLSRCQPLVSLAGAQLLGQVALAGLEARVVRWAGGRGGGASVRAGVPARFGGGPHTPHKTRGGERGLPPQTARNPRTTAPTHTGPARTPAHRNPRTTAPTHTGPARTPAHRTPRAPAQRHTGTPAHRTTAHRTTAHRSKNRSGGGGEDRKEASDIGLL